MANILSWISVAHNLAENQELGTQKLDEAFQSFEKMQKKFSEAKELIISFTDRRNLSKEDVATAQTYFRLRLMELKQKQRELIAKTVESCIASLKSIYRHSKDPDDNIRVLVKEVDEKVKETRLDKSFGKVYPTIFGKLERTIQRLKSVVNF